MSSIVRLTLLIILTAASGTTPAHADWLTQSSSKPPPSMKPPIASDLPPSAVRKTFDRARNTASVTIDIPLSIQSREAAIPGRPRISAGQIDLSFRLDYKGPSVSDLSAAYLTITFVSLSGQLQKFTAGNVIEVQADAYEYSYPDAAHEKEQLTPPSDTPEGAALTAERITLKLPA
ncbi:MAG: hypothetical protein WKF30_01755 [Pyrinomonadaceae bacterium]